MAQIDKYLTACINRKGSDLHIASEAPVFVRQLGKLQPITPEPLAAADCEQLLMEILDDSTQAKLQEDWEVDMAYAMENGERFRVNVYRQRKGLDAVFRHFGSKIYPLKNWVCRRSSKNSLTLTKA